MNGLFIEQSKNIKQLVQDNPELPVLVLVDTEVVADDDYSDWICPQTKCFVGEILDYDCNYTEEKIFINRDDFAEAVQFYLEDMEEYADTTDEEFDQILHEELQKYDRYWKPVIIIHGSI